MYYSIAHEVPGRLRVRLNGVVRQDDVDPLLRVLLDCTAIQGATIYPRIGSIAITYGTLEGASTRRRVLDFLDAVDGTQLDAVRSDYTYALATRTHDLVLDLACTVGGFVARRLFLPAALNMVYAIWQYRHFLRLALGSLARGKLDVASLDAAAIGASFAQGDASTASETMFLLDVGEVLEDYTRAQSANELIYSLLSVPDLASRVGRGQEIGVPATDLAEGDLVVVRTGQPVPIDGTIERGVGMVNQAALTGEPLAVERAVGDSVYAGTSLEEGEIFVRVSKPANKTRLRSIVSLVEQSGEQKSVAEARRERLANGIVPWNFLLSALYLAVDGVLVGVLGIEDPIKKGARQAIRDLRALGFDHVVMLTGDNRAAAQRVAESVGVTEWVANMLPEQKYEYVRKLRASGRRVVMVGDGVNDSPALREANVGVAMAAGTAIAREVADITLTDPDLGSLVRLRKLSQGLMRRLDRSFWEIMLWNSGLLAAGIGGTISPQTSSLLHNTSTVVLGASAMRNYLV